MSRRCGFKELRENLLPKKNDNIFYVAQMRPSPFELHWVHHEVIIIIIYFIILAYILFHTL